MHPPRPRNNRPTPRRVGRKHAGVAHQRKARRRDALSTAPDTLDDADLEVALDEVEADAPTDEAREALDAMASRIESIRKAVA